MRTHYCETIDEIRSDVIRMGTKANEMVREAVEATLNGDPELASRVLSQDDAVDAMERDIHNKAVLTVMQEAPVGKDLRMLVATMGIVGEIEKAADDAVKLSRRATKLQNQFPTEMKRALLELGEQTRNVFSSSIRLFTDYSPELAAEIIEADKEVDSKYAQARDRVFELIRQNPQATEHMVRTIEAFHAVEHVADHAVAIAVRMRMLNEAHRELAAQ